MGKVFFRFPRRLNDCSKVFHWRSFVRYLFEAKSSFHVTDHIAAQVGYLFIAGRAHSVIGQYRRNDEGFVQLEYQL